MSLTDYPAFKFDTDAWADDQFYCKGDFMWDVRDLWSAAKHIAAYDVPLIAVHSGDGVWDGVQDSILTFARHCLLVNKAQLRYPIILDPDGVIADGRHRLVKAMITGKQVIRAKRLSAMPAPTYVMQDGEAVPFTV